MTGVCMFQTGTGTKEEKGADCPAEKGGRGTEGDLSGPVTYVVPT